MAVNEEGKYTKLTDETVQKLETCFAMDCSIPEACSYADISTRTYYNWVKDNPEMEERFLALRQRPFLKARQTIMRSLENQKGAQWYMERKKKAEFAPKSEIDHTTLGESIKEYRITRGGEEVKNYENKLEQGTGDQSGTDGSSSDESTHQEGV